MMKTMMALMMGLASTAAYADGFVCETVAGDLNVKVYNHTQPALGTRTAAVMVVSDPMIHEGRQTIARFTDSNATLDSVGALYLAKVDLRFNDSGRKGELIAGTRLGELKSIAMRVDFSYAEPMAEGARTTGVLVLGKRDGDKIRLDLNCTRYLAN